MRFTVQKWLQCFPGPHQMRSIVLTHCWARLILQESPSHSSDIIRWECSILKTGNIGLGGGNGRRGTGEKAIQQLKELCQNDVTLSICAAFSRLQLPPVTVHHNWRRFFFSFPWIVQILQRLIEVAKPNRLEHSNHSYSQLYDYLEYSSELVFSESCMFRICNDVNKKNAIISGVEPPDDNNRLFWKIQVFWHGVQIETICSPTFQHCEQYERELQK